MKNLQDVLAKIEKLDGSLAAKTQKRLDNLTKPQGSLGKLEDLAKQIVEITQNENPNLKNKVIFTFAGDHGVTQEGVSAFPQEVTTQMVYNFVSGGAAINVLARHVGARVVVADLGIASNLNTTPGVIIKKVKLGTKNMTHTPAMTREEALTAIENGIIIFEQELKNGIDIIGTGEMGIGNTTPSSAIVSAITGEKVSLVTGTGTGISEEALSNKTKIIQKTLDRHKPNPQDAIDVLSKVGGFEIGGLVGVILAATANRIPVVLDGFISGAAALLAYTLEPKTKDYMIASHCSVEQGHKISLDFIGLSPILDLNFRLGEGTGAALSMTIIEASVKILKEMATFESAAVSEKLD